MTTHFHHIFCSVKPVPSHLAPTEASVQRSTKDCYHNIVPVIFDDSSPWTLFWFSLRRSPLWINGPLLTWQKELGQRSLCGPSQDCVGCISTNTIVSVSCRRHLYSVSESAFTASLTVTVVLLLTEQDLARVSLWCVQSLHRNAIPVSVKRSTTWLHWWYL